MAKLYRGTIRLVAEEVAFDNGKVADIPFIRRVEAGLIGFRSKLIREEYAKTGRLPAALEDKFCVPLIPVSAAECCVTVDSTCKIFRSRDKVPAGVRTFDGTDFTYVGDVKGSKAYSYIVPEEYDFILSTRFSKYQSYYAYFNNFLYTFNSPNRKLGVRGVFDNPSELLTLKNCEGTPCIEDIKITMDMAKIMKEWIKQELRMDDIAHKIDAAVNEPDTQN